MEGRGEAKRAGVLDGRERTVVYALVALVLVAIAAASLILVPRGSGTLQSCRNIVMRQNRDSCLSYLASETKNVSVCRYVSPASSDYCYASVARLTENASVCTMISGQNETYDCVFGIANATGAYATCSYLGGSQKAYCIEHLAESLGNVTACSTLNSSDAQICSSAIYFDRASSGDNATYCALVSNTTDQNITASILALSGAFAGPSGNMTLGLALGGAGYLQNGGNGFAVRDLCYMEVATALKSPAECARISNATLLSACNQSAYGGAVANFTGNGTLPSSFCSQYVGQNVSSCNNIISITEAISTKNASYCADINYTLSRYQCYAAMARAYNSTSYCGYISNSSANQECVQNINYNVTQ